MLHFERMISRLPLLYREGGVVSEIVMQPGLQMELIEDVAREIAQHHWFNTTWELEDARKLAAILDIEHEEWQDLKEYRAWVHSLRNAWLRKTGTVTRAGLVNFVTEYSQRYQKAVNIAMVQGVNSWADEESTTNAALIENPISKQLFSFGNDLIAPLHQTTIINKGLDPSFPNIFIHNTSSENEYIPLIANTSTQQAIIYAGTLSPGQRLWIGINDDGTAKGTLERQDVSDKLMSVSYFTPGEPWDEANKQQPATPLAINRGENLFWFFPCALYDFDGLDRYLSTLADLKLQQGIFDEGSFDHALFHQDALVSISIGFAQVEPASIKITIPAGLMLSASGAIDEAVESRTKLEASLSDGVNRLKGAGVVSELQMISLSETQPQRDYLIDYIPKKFSMVGPTGSDKVPDTSGIFGKSTFNTTNFN